MRKMAEIVPWLIQKMRHNPESLLALLIAAHGYEQNARLASAAFRAGYRVGQRYPGTPLDPPDYEI